MLGKVNLDAVYALSCHQIYDVVSLAASIHRSLNTAGEMGAALFAITSSENPPRSDDYCQQKTVCVC